MDGKLELVLAEAAPAASAAAGATENTLPTSSSRSSSNNKAAAAATKAATAATKAAATDQHNSDPAASAATTATPPADPAAAAALDTLDMEQQLRRMRLVAQQSDGLLALLAAKYCSADPVADEAQPSSCTQAADPNGDAGPALAPRPHRPLHWFGSLPPPSLRYAEAHFRRALALAVLAANARRALQRGIDDASALRSDSMTPVP